MVLQRLPLHTGQQTTGVALSEGRMVPTLFGLLCCASSSSFSEYVFFFLCREHALVCEYICCCKYQNCCSIWRFPVNVLNTGRVKIDVWII